MDLTVEEIVRRVANGHAYDKHAREFEDSKYGPVLPITTRDEFRAHIATVLESRDTQCFTALKGMPWREADVFYHEPTNTLVVVPADPAHEPTAHRPDTGVDFFRKKHEEVCGPHNSTVPIVHSIYELRPELARQQNRETLNDATPETDELKTLHESLDRRFQDERKKTLDRHTAQTVALGNAPTDDPRRSALRQDQEQELLELKTRQDQERDRYTREHERAREIAAELERKRDQKRLRDEFNRGKGRGR